MKYTVNLDNNNYILSISHTKNDNVEIDLSTIDVQNLDCYKLQNGVVVLDEHKKAERDSKMLDDIKQAKIAELKAELATYDYIGIKIAMGVATVEEYADKIAYTETLRAKINELQK